MDYREIFMRLPVACAVLHDRTVTDCNDLFCELWRDKAENIKGVSFSQFYSSVEDFELRGRRIAPILAEKGEYADSWLLKRGGNEIFWCHVNGVTLDRSKPYERVIWTFAELSGKPDSNLSIGSRLTPREREIAKLLYEGCSSKEVARRLDISHRTVHIHRANLLKKYAVRSTTDLLKIISV
jgi:DNA-binding CsgD family transcriptional regulator